MDEPMSGIQDRISNFTMSKYSKKNESLFQKESLFVYCNSNGRKKLENTA